MKRRLSVPISILISLFCLYTWPLSGKVIGLKKKIEYTDTTLVKYLDTNIIVYRADFPIKGRADLNTKSPLRYYQYADLINTGQYVIRTDNDKLYLSRIPDELLKRGLMDNSFLIKMNLYPLAKKSTASPYWNRKLIKNIPAEIDTNRVFYDQDNTRLKFYQYLGILFNGSGYFRMEKGERRLWRLSDLYLKDYPADLDPDTGKRVADVYLQLLQADNVLVMKGSRKVYLQRKGKTFLTFSCDLGRNPVGDKHEEGDRRTPEGLYTLSGKSTQGKYGKSYLISYPDSAHIAAAKQKGVLPGSQVMIHGTSAERSKLKDWTNGCIAISNAHMDSLFKYVMPGTPINIRK